LRRAMMLTSLRGAIRPAAGALPRNSLAPTAVLARSLRVNSPALASEVAKPSSGPITPEVVHKYFDGESLMEHQARTRHADPGNRSFHYAMIGGARLIGASAWRLALIKFLAQMNPSAEVMALSQLEVDISKLNPGDCMTVKWRGKPVFIKSRTGGRTLSLWDTHIQ